MKHKQRYLIKFIIELIIAVGYLFSWLPILATYTLFGGFIALFWMIPLIFLVILLDFVWRDKEVLNFFSVDIFNLVIASLLWVPVISLALPLAGILVSLSIAFINYNKISMKILRKSDKNKSIENIIEVESKPIK